MAEALQSYQKHVRWLPGFHFFVIPVLLVNTVNSIRHVWQQPNLHYGWEAAVAAALLVLGFLSRIPALTVQERVVRLEMGLPLRRLLPPDLQPSINELTHPPLVAMRVASDAEMAGRVRHALARKPAG